MILLIMIYMLPEASTMLLNNMLVLLQSQVYHVVDIDDQNVTDLVLLHIELMIQWYAVTEQMNDRLRSTDG